MSSQAEREYDALYDDFEKVRGERDALAQRCRELEACIAGHHTNLVALLRVGLAQAERERDTLRDEIAQYRDIAYARVDECGELRAEVKALRELLKK